MDERRAEYTVSSRDFAGWLRQLYPAPSSVNLEYSDRVIQTFYRRPCHQPAIAMLQHCKTMRFSTRALFVLILAIAMPFAWYANQVRLQQRERLAMHKIQEAIPNASFSNQLMVPRWLAEFGLQPQVMVRICSVDLTGLSGGGKHSFELADDDIQAVIPHLSQLPHLTRLYLYHTDVTDACLADVGALKTLEYVNVEGTAVTHLAASRQSKAPQGSPMTFFGNWHNRSVAVEQMDEREPNIP